VHFCLGAHLARMELEAFFRELLPRLEHVELAGQPESMATTFVGGPKRLPIRYRVRPAGRCVASEARRRNAPGTAPDVTDGREAGTPSCAGA
jgi:hypothetical protein